ncbi:CD209 antigen-like protein C [Myripristis murdjan]|uniref:CD209 antigen-like protein C n=1 Tax=Myripristis murdjan TaxID=586833 RepID=UPI001175D87F|nr:CD209 antigen-like protein C [Myripristis murdjan]
MVIGLVALGEVVVDNLTEERNQLQTSLNNLTEERNQLWTSLNSMTQERNQLQTSLNSTTQETNQLQTSLNSMTQEKCQLQVEIERLTLKITELTSQICPDGWITFSRSCYFISSESKSWDESRQDCLKRGADLVIIKSKEEEPFLKKFHTRVWIGLSDRETEGVWKWVDGSSLSYTFWASGEPNDRGGEDCVELSQGRDGFNDESCSDKLPWICQK